MAVKPSAHPTVRASNANYVGGLRIGTPTKAAHPNAADGWQVGQKPPAQAQNSYDNSLDLHAEWVDEGTSTAALEARIVETDDDGQAAIASVSVGGVASNDYALVIAPNTVPVGSGGTASGLICSTGSSKSGAIFRQLDRTVSSMIVQSNVASGASGVGVVRLENTVTNGTRLVTVNADSDDESAVVMSQAGFASLIEVTAGSGVSGVANGQAGVLLIAGEADGANDGGPALRCTSPASQGNIVEIATANAAHNGDCLVVTAQNRAHAIIGTQTGGRSPAARFAGGDGGGADRSAPLLLVPAQYEPAGEGFQDGSLYVLEYDDSGSDRHQLMALLGGETKSVMTARGAMCGIQYAPSNVSGIVPDGTYDELFTKSFANDYQPVEAGDVHISLRCTVQRGTVTSDILATDDVQIRIIDETASDTVITTVSLDIAPQNIGDLENTIETSQFIDAIYTLPAAGPRTFRAEARVFTTRSGSFNVKRMFFEVKPHFAP